VTPNLFKDLIRENTSTVRKGCATTNTLLLFCAVWGCTSHHPCLAGGRCASFHLEKITRSNAALSKHQEAKCCQRILYSTTTPYSTHNAPYKGMPSSPTISRDKSRRNGRERHRYYPTGHSHCLAKILSMHPLRALL
jgi:hypothetical protein